jgi:hypothetical protein
LDDIDLRQAVYPQLTEIAKSDNQIEKWFYKYDNKFTELFLIGLLKMEQDLNEKSILLFIVEKLSTSINEMRNIGLFHQSSLINGLLTCISSCDQIPWIEHSVEIFNFTRLIIRY